MIFGRWPWPYESIPPLACRWRSRKKHEVRGLNQKLDFTHKRPRSVLDHRQQGRVDVLEDDSIQKIGPLRRILQPEDLQSCHE